MCRLYGFLANELTKVECSLVRAQNALLEQSRKDLRGISNADGWGIAVYENHLPKVERRATAAHQDVHFSETVERIFARTVIAHVRDATVGMPSPVNTHPFFHGRWVFAHNGTVQGFPELGEELARESSPHLLDERAGGTDSEMAFLWLLSRLERTGVDLEAESPSDIEVLIDVVAQSVAKLSRRCREKTPELQERLNFLLTDGQQLVVSRWHNSLWYVERQGVHDCEVCGIPHVLHDDNQPYRAVVVASEPISHEQWQEVPEGHILTVEKSLETTLHRI
jgi:glutamine amidotransferase